MKIQKTKNEAIDWTNDDLKTNPEQVIQLTKLSELYTIEMQNVNIYLTCAVWWLHETGN